MNYAHAQLITSHAPLVGAPSVRGYDPISEMIKQEQLRGLQIRNNPALTPQQAQIVQPARTLTSSGSNGSGGSRSYGASDLALKMSQRNHTDAQTKLLGLQAQKLQNELDSDYLVESTYRFGKHSNDAEWDGSGWVRRWRPGEKEALVLDQVLGVKDKWSKEAEERAYDRQKETEAQKTKDDIDRQNNASANRIGEYIAKLRADQATKPDVTTPLEKQKRELIYVAISAANRRKRQFGDVGTTDKVGGSSFDADYDAANSNFDGIRANYQEPDEVDGATNSEEGTNASKSDVGEESSSGTDVSSGGEDVSVIDQLAGY